MNVIRIPANFYDDHVMRELPAPPELRRHGFRHVWIDTDHPAMDELVEDARFYVHEHGPEEGPWKAAARALIKSLRLQGIST